LKTDRQELIQRVRLANREMYRRVWDNTIVDWIQLDLTMAQVKLLFILQHASLHEETVFTVGLVAERLGIGVPAASHLIDRLVNQSLVTRVEDQADRRRALLGLTETGRDLANRLQEGTRDRHQRWVAQLSDDDLEALARGIGALVIAADLLEGRSANVGPTVANAADCDSHFPRHGEESVR
jgi:DNA-binding MarR family transcriptional regulator